MLYICITNENKRLFIVMSKIQNILIIILLLAVTFLAGLSLHSWHKVKELTGQAPTVITDTVTLTDVQFDTIFICSYTRDTLAVVDTAFIYDTITHTYYVTAEVPIYTHVIDTSIYYTNFSLSLHERVRGYGVTIDTLALDYNAIVTPVKPQKKLRVVPAIGIGYGTGGVGLFGGVGLSYW